MKIEIDPDRANLVGIRMPSRNLHRCRNQRQPVGIYKEGNKNIPIVVRLGAGSRTAFAN